MDLVISARFFILFHLKFVYKTFVKSMLELQVKHIVILLVFLLIYD